MNVNGVRAAARKGMGDWLAARDVDVLALQEVRAERADLVTALGPGWIVLNDEAAAKGRAGVAVAVREGGAVAAPTAHRARIGGESADSSGRWLEADLEAAGVPFTVVSAYVHSGEVGTPRQDAKYAFLAAMTERMPALGEHAVVVGDLNVGHTTRDIKNWRGNVKKAGFLPEERAYFDAFFGEAGARLAAQDGSTVTGLGYVDVGRRWAGDVDGPYTWWSNRGQAFDNDTGWRIDYHAATPALAATVADYRVDRAPSYDARWSDHAPVVVDYLL